MMDYYTFWKLIMMLVIVVAVAYVATQIALLQLLKRILDELRKRERYDCLIV